MVFNAYNPPPQVGLHCTDETRTQQHFKLECDVNTILAKFLRTGLLAQLQGGTYLDVSEAPEYQQAMNLINEANETFAQLPSNIRKEFDNSPAKFMEFMHNPRNSEKAEELGLKNRSINLTNLQNDPKEPKSELS